MTATDADSLTGEIEQALWGLLRVYDAPHGGTETGVHAPVHEVVSAVLPIIAAEVQAASERAWDDCADQIEIDGGAESAWTDHLREHNPYRTTETGDRA